MPTFQYVASGQKGESVRGTLPASDKNEVIQKLKAKGLFLVSCRVQEGTVVSSPSAARPSTNYLPVHSPAATIPALGKPAAPWWADLIGHSKEKKVKDPKKGKISLKELVVFTRQISISINAGMPIVEALQSIQEHARNPKLAITMKIVLDDVLAGRKFSDALATHPDVFKPVYVSMVSAGEAGGFVPDALNRVAEFLEKEMELKGKIRSAMVYPALIAIVAFCVVTFMMLFIVPIFVGVFKEMGAPLPLPTLMLVDISSIMKHGGFLTPLLLVGIYWYLMKLKAKNEKFRVWWDKRILHVPIFGKLTTLSIITRFIRTLATLVDNGVMALLALSISRQVVENRTIEAVVDEIFSSVQQGNGISPVLYKSQYFPVLVANMVSTGEKTGELPTVLTKMADYYDAEVSNAIQDMLTMMEPLLIVVMAVVVGFIIAGLMLPTFEMSSLVS